MNIKQEVCRKYAPLRYGALCLCAVPAFWGLSLLLDAGVLAFLPLPLLLAVGAAYYFPSYTYRFDGATLEISSGGLLGPKVLTQVDVEDIVSCGVYLPGQLSARTASRVIRATLFLDPSPKRYFLYRLEDGGTGLVIFSPDRTLQEVFIRDSWMFQPS